MQNLNFFLKNQLKQKKLEVVNFSIRLENLSVKKVLKRGFAIIKDVKSKSILKYKILKTNQLIDIEFHNGNVAAKTIKSHE
jgi:exonuclease VII large subunit